MPRPVPCLCAFVVVGNIVATAAADRCGTWQWTNPVPHPVALRAVAAGGGMILALGGNQVATSLDGVSWDVGESGTPPFAQGGWDGWSDVIWDGRQFVAVGGLYIASSDDGVSWKLRYTGATSPRSDQFQAIAFNGQRYVAVAYNAWGPHTAAVTSTDLDAWSPADGLGFISGGPSAIIAKGSSFVVVGGGGVATIDADGNVMQALPDVYGADVAWSGRELVAVSPTGVFRSLDGFTWEDASVPRTGLRGITWTGSEFVAVGDAGAVVTSPDGVTWEDHSVAIQYELGRVTWTGSELVAVGNNILTSGDGISWRAWAQQVTSASLSAIAWNGTAFVAVGAAGEIVRSPNGIAWTRTREPGGFGRLGGLESVVWTGDRFVGLGERNAVDLYGNPIPGSVVVSSPDGVTWSTTIFGVNLQSVAWNGERFVAVGIALNGGGNELAVSEDAVTWQRLSPPGWSCCWGWFAVAGVPGRFVASVGPSTLAGSTDGEHWITTELPSGSWVDRLATGGGTFVAFGQEVFASSDGIVWTPAVGIGGASAVVWLGHHFLAWDEQGNALRSADGIVWEPADGGPPTPPDGIGALAASDHAIVGVGTGGTIARSACPAPGQVRRRLVR